MTEMVTEISTEIIRDTVVKVSNLPDIKVSDILFYGLLVFAATNLLQILFELIRFLCNMAKLQKVGIYIENLTEEQIKTIIDTGKIETIEDVSFSLSMKKVITVPCQIEHKTRGQGRNEIIISYNDNEYNIVVPEPDIEKYQIGDTVNVKIELIVSENNTETVKSCALCD